MSGTSTPSCATVLDVRHRCRGLVAVDRDAHELGAGARQCGHLARGAFDVGGVGVGHRLHDDRRAAADDHAADVHGNRFMTFLRVHTATGVPEGADVTPGSGPALPAGKNFILPPM